MKAEMKAGRRSVVVFVALLLVVLVGAIALVELGRRASDRPEASNRERSFAPTDPFPRRLTDATGGEVVINERPRRIASQTIGTDEVLLAICDPARVVRLSPLAFDERYSNIIHEARAANLAAAQNAEEILSANPDLVFVASYSRAETIALLRAAGAPVFRLAAFDSFSDIKSNMRTIGYLVGEDAAAAALIQKMEADLARVRERIPAERREGNRLRVMSYSASGNSAGARTLFDDIVRAAGATNVTAEKGFDGFPQISAEQLVAWNPDYIIASAEEGEFDIARARLLANPGVRASEAGRHNRIIIIDNRTLLAVSHHITKAVESLARGLYGGEESEVRSQKTE